jgi:hypothetical protein
MIFCCSRNFSLAIKSRLVKTLGAAKICPPHFFPPAFVQKALITLVILLRGKNIALEGEPEGDTVKICTSRLVFFSAGDKSLSGWRTRVPRQKVSPLHLLNEEGGLINARKLRCTNDNNCLNVLDARQGGKRQVYSVPIN